MRITLLVVALACTSCIDVFRGAIVQMNLTRTSVNQTGQHYQLYAVVNGGAVELARFKVLDSVQQCGRDPDLAPPVKLVQAYDDGMDVTAQCDPDGRLGTVDLVETSTTTLLGGVRVDTPVDLSDAEAVFVTLEVDGDSDPRPGTLVLHADLARGLDPYVERAATCTQLYCDGLDPEARAADPSCQPVEAPANRRGVLLGTLLRTPVRACGNTVEGEVAIVPAEDDEVL